MLEFLKKHNVTVLSMNEAFTFNVREKVLIESFIKKDEIENNIVKTEFFTQSMNNFVKNSYTILIETESEKPKIVLNIYHQNDTCYIRGVGYYDNVVYEKHISIHQILSILGEFMSFNKIKILLEDYATLSLEIRKDIFPNKNTNLLQEGNKTVIEFKTGKPKYDDC